VKLWTFQKTAVDELHKAFETNRRVLLVAPTGSGKTVMASSFIAGLPANERVLFIGHRIELLRQAVNRLKADGIAPERYTVTSVFNRYPLAGFRWVVVDEAHHIRAATYEYLLEDPKTKLLGLTATPWRLDGRGLVSAFDASVMAATPAELLLWRPCLALPSGRTMPRSLQVAN
jgi:DNA repair protein RadD